MLFLVMMMCLVFPQASEAHGRQCCNVAVVPVCAAPDAHHGCIIGNCCIPCSHTHATVYCKPVVTCCAPDPCSCSKCCTPKVCCYKAEKVAQCAPCVPCCTPVVTCCAPAPCSCNKCCVKVACVEPAPCSCGHCKKVRCKKPGRCNCSKCVVKAPCCHHAPRIKVRYCVPTPCCKPVVKCAPTYNVIPSAPCYLPSTFVPCGKKGDSY